MSLKIPPPRNKDSAMGANHVEVGAYPSPSLAQTWKNDKNYNYFKKFVIRISKQDLFQNLNSGGVAWTNGGITKYQFQPITSRGYGEHWELYATWEYICTDTYISRTFVAQPWCCG